MYNKSICYNCKLRVGDYCFSGDMPEKVIDNSMIINCNYFCDDSKSSYYEFIDGYEHCNKLKKIALHKKIKELESEIEDLKPHGEWLYPDADIVIGKRRIGKSRRVCSICNESFTNNIPWNAKFCPNCGADMRGKENA